MQHHHHQRYVDRRRSESMNNSNKTTYDDFYRKLERIRLSAKQNPQRTATELLDESKAFFVKSKEVLHNRQTLSTITSSFLIPQSEDEFQFDHPLQSSTSSRTNNSDCLFESVSVFSYSDQTILDRTNTSLERKRTNLPSSITIIERNARIIKWLFQLHQINESDSFQSS